MTLSDPELSRPSRAAAKAETRRRLLDAAREVFVAVGYQGATLDEIAARAGFTKGALYWHFPNKRAIFLALVTDSIDSNLGILDGLLANHAQGPEEVRDALGQWIDGIDARETLPVFGVELEIEARRDPAFRKIHQGMIVQHERALADFLTRYFRFIGAQPSMNIPDLAATLITLFKGFALIRQNRPDIQVTSAKAVRVLLGLPLDD